jgi:hypothetical protein
MLESPFDRQARVNLRREVVEVTLPIYLNFVASQVMSWSEAETPARAASARKLYMLAM